MSTILLCMTPGVSLLTWKKLGTIKREIRPYLSLIQEGWEIKLLTFLHEKSRTYQLPNSIQTIFFPHHRLLSLLPYTHYSLASKIDLIQTNQSRGAWYYTRAARLWQKPSLLRCGFVYGEGLETVYGLTKNVQKYQELESVAFNQATFIELTTPYLANWVINNYHVSPEKIEVIPNYVDTSLFRPDPVVGKFPRSVVSVGNLHRIKRFDLLLQACAKAKVNIVRIYGDGPERPNLQLLAEKLQVNLELPGVIENENLPNAIQNFQVFVITSMREGHPKSLVEAMACGLSCVGVNVVGIRECLQESQAGILVEANSYEIGDAIAYLFDHPETRKKLAVRGQEFVELTMNYSLIISKKRSLLERCISSSNQQ